MLQFLYDSLPVLHQSDIDRWNSGEIFDPSEPNSFPNLCSIKFGMSELHAASTNQHGKSIDEESGDMMCRKHVQCYISLFDLSVPALHA